MEATTQEKVDNIVRQAKGSRKGDHAAYSQFKRQLEILPLTHKEYEDTIIKICRELRI